MAPKKTGTKVNNLNQLNGISNKIAITMLTEVRENLKKSAGFDMLAGKDDYRLLNTNEKVLEKTADLLKFGPNLLTLLQNIVENLQDSTATFNRDYLNSVNYNDNGLVAFVRDMARLGRDIYKVGESNAQGIVWIDKIKSMMDAFQNTVKLYAQIRNDQKEIQGLPQLSFAYAGLVFLGMDRMVADPSASYEITHLFRDLLHLHTKNPSGVVSSELLKFIHSKQPKPVERKPRVKKDKPATNKVENVQSNNTSTSSSSTTNDASTSTASAETKTESFDF